MLLVKNTKCLTYGLTKLDCLTEEDHARPWTDVTVPELKAFFWLANLHGNTNCALFGNVLVNEDFYLQSNLASVFTLVR